jgi:hypothetical protein
MIFDMSPRSRRGRLIMYITSTQAGLSSLHGPYGKAVMGGCSVQLSSRTDSPFTLNELCPCHRRSVGISTSVHNKKRVGTDVKNDLKMSSASTPTTSSFTFTFTSIFTQHNYPINIQQGHGQASPIRIHHLLLPLLGPRPRQFTHHIYASLLVHPIATLQR